MKSFLNKAMLTLVVFGLAIVSSFAMETDPPTEPVKTTVETEVVANNMEQPTLLEEGYGYKDAFGNCVIIPDKVPDTNCSPNNSGITCTENVSGILHNLYFMTRASTSSPWVCGDLLKKP